MRPPCQHILAARINAKLDLFIGSLCDKYHAAYVIHKFSNINSAEEIFQKLGNFCVITWLSFTDITKKNLMDTYLMEINKERSKPSERNLPIWPLFYYRSITNTDTHCYIYSS